MKVLIQRATVITVQPDFWFLIHIMSLFHVRQKETNDSFHAMISTYNRRNVEIKIRLTIFQPIDVQAQVKRYVIISSCLSLRLYVNGPGSKRLLIGS